ncbi:Protein BIG GRAIN 1-like A [Cardamine amara subsp. amara]|uniref:Protein BIG GRAIN 1-like A n=1 Tax=Cardamine amara subsp. amara TaxID=228776 RepID=A0ABD1AZE4_CARAN
MIGCLWAEAESTKLSRKTRGNDYHLSPSSLLNNTLLLLLLPLSPSISIITSLMETWEKPISSSHHRHPSFSSTLLDQIYRSIDDSPTVESTRNKKHHRNTLEDLEISPASHRRSIAVDFERSKRTTTTAISDSVFLGYSNSSSSDSSGLSSSESDSFYGRSKSSASPPPITRQQPKPIRTSLDYSGNVQKPKELGGFLRTKSKALKIYTDLKKVKQPISPGGRLATFLNSLFTNAATNSKKHKKTNTTVSAVTEPQYSSTCSSASSFSRSCLSKTPSSSGKSKRSVRFCPVNVILDEDSSIHMPYPRLYGNNERHVMEEENRRVIEAAKDLLRTYHKNKNMTTTTCDDVEEEDDDEDDAASYASSDLFELENLSAIGIERSREELPVYETTRLDNTNRAIATTGLIV